MPERRPGPPPGIGPHATRLWRALVDRYELEPTELTVLREIVRVIGRCEALDAVVRACGPMDPTGSGRVNAALVEARQQQLALAKLVGALRLPVDEDRASGAAAISDAMSAIASARWRKASGRGA